MTDEERLKSLEYLGIDYERANAKRLRLIGRGVGKEKAFDDAFLCEVERVLDALPHKPNSISMLRAAVNE